jgi:pyruvate kinase
LQPGKMAISFLEKPLDNIPSARLTTCRYKSYNAAGTLCLKCSEYYFMRRTKIVCTIGPATSSPEALRELARAGMDVARLNFSHGSHETHGRTIAHLRALSEELGRPIAILLDLSGPKVRIGNIAGDGIVLRPGQEVTLTLDDVPGDEGRINLPVPEIFEAVGVGAHLMLDDGSIDLRVKQKKRDSLICEVEVGGPLSSHKGVNVPDISLPLAAVTDKDLADLHFGIEHKVDWVAASFVRSPTDIAVLRGVCEAARAKIPLIAKIEKHEAVHNIDGILSVVDGIMVARGDLGVEMPIYEVPVTQKMLIRKANRVGKPVITATQMLDSMIRNPRPTRAEVTDVANAIFDGTDAIMLSGETAVGAYPFDAVRMMAKVAERAESSLVYAKILDDDNHAEIADRVSITSAIGEATCDIAHDLQCAAILTATSSGRTAQVISRYRPRALIVAATDRWETYQRLALIWGVHPVVVGTSKDADDLMQVCVDGANKSGLVHDDDIVVITGGVPVGRSGNTNFIKIHQIGRPLRPE